MCSRTHGHTYPENPHQSRIVQAQISPRVRPSPLLILQTWFGDRMSPRSLQTYQINHACFIGNSKVLIGLHPSKTTYDGCSPSTCFCKCKISGDSILLKSSCVFLKVYVLYSVVCNNYVSMVFIGKISRADQLSILLFAALGDVPTSNWNFLEGF